MRIDRRPHRPPAGLDVGEKAQQRRQIVALRKALFLHQAFAVKHGVWIKKAVGGDEIDLGHVRPARQQGLQHARRGRFADRNRAADPDDVRHLGIFGAEKALLRAKQPLRRRDVERQQPRQRQIDFLDLRHVEPVVHRAQPRDLGRLQRHRRILAQRRPFGAREHAIGRHVLLRFAAPSGCPQPPLRAAFSSRPDWRVRAPSSASTSSSVMPRACSTTRR